MTSNDESADHHKALGWVALSFPHIASGLKRYDQFIRGSVMRD